jgi:hypothetical protein
VVGIDEPLERALAERPVADHSWRHGTHRQVLAQQVGGTLAAVQTRLEIPQWTLAAHRLVDRLLRHVATSHRDQERGVRAPRHAAIDLWLGVHQEGDRVGDRLGGEPAQFMRGHA